MKALYLRIYLTVVAALLLFAFVSGALVQRHIEDERTRAEGVLGERMAAWAELIQRSLPGADRPADEQAAALSEWSERLRLPLALDSAAGQRIGTSAAYARRVDDGAGRGLSVRLEDGRTLWVMRPRPPRIAVPEGRGFAPPEAMHNLPFASAGWSRGLSLVALLVVLFIAVALGAFPVVRRLTRRLEALKQGVDRFGEGALDHRVEVVGHDEVAAVAASFNQAAGRIEVLMRAHRSLLANASHELRSPLARLKMAVAMLGGAPSEQAERLQSEIATNIAELDALVEEVLLASRLDAATALDHDEPVDVLAVAAEAAARAGVELAAHSGEALPKVRGDERLLRRAVRNLLENAFRYGGQPVVVDVALRAGRVELAVTDHGPGVPEALRERIFEAFYRLPGHAEQAGGVGLGLSLVRQIAQRHGGSVRCEAVDGGGSRFVISLPPLLG